MAKWKKYPYRAVLQGEGVLNDQSEEIRRSCALLAWLASDLIGGSNLIPEGEQYATLTFDGFDTEGFFWEVFVGKPPESENYSVIQIKFVYDGQRFLRWADGKLMPSVEKWEAFPPAHASLQILYDGMREKIPQLSHRLHELGKLGQTKR